MLALFAASVLGKMAKPVNLDMTGTCKGVAAKFKIHIAADEGMVCSNRPYTTLRRARRCERKCGRDARCNFYRVRRGRCFLYKACEKKAMPRRGGRKNRRANRRQGGPVRMKLCDKCEAKSVKTCNEDADCGWDGKACVKRASSFDKRVFLDQTCGKVLCVPKDFDLSKIVWVQSYYKSVMMATPDSILAAGAPKSITQAGGMFKMMKGYIPFMHAHTNYHAGVVLQGAKKTWRLGEDKSKVQALHKGDVFEVLAKEWHVDELIDESGEDTIVYLRFQHFQDVLWPLESSDGTMLNQLPYFLTKKDIYHPMFLKQ